MAVLSVNAVISPTRPEHTALYKITDKKVSLVTDYFDTSATNTGLVHL